jgi:hypothetical protein
MRFLLSVCVIAAQIDVAHLYWSNHGWSKTPDEALAGMASISMLILVSIYIQLCKEKT